MAFREVASVDELHRLIWGRDNSRDLSNHAVLDEAHRLWSAVSTSSGYDQIYNVHMLMAKDDARNVVLEKLDHLRRWVCDIDDQVALLQAQIDALDDAVQTPGPLLPRSYEPILSDGPEAYFDIDQLGEDENVDHHIHEKSPGHPLPRDRYWSLPEFQARETKDQRALTDFNISFLQIGSPRRAEDRANRGRGAGGRRQTSLRTIQPEVSTHQAFKRDCLLALRTRIQQGVAALEQYKSDRTVLGCGSGRDYFRFFDIRGSQTPMTRSRMTEV